MYGFKGKSENVRRRKEIIIIIYGIGRDFRRGEEKVLSELV